MTFDLISGFHMQIQTWYPPVRLCIHAKYYVKSGLTNVLKNANKTKNMHLFSIRIAKCLGPTKLDVNCLIEVSTVLVFYTLLIFIVQTHTHTKRHQTPLK